MSPCQKKLNLIKLREFLSKNIVYRLYIYTKPLENELFRRIISLSFIIKHKKCNHIMFGDNFNFCNSHCTRIKCSAIGLFSIAFNYLKFWLYLENDEFQSKTFKHLQGSHILLDDRLKFYTFFNFVKMKRKAVNDGFRFILTFNLYCKTRILSKFPYVLIS